MGSLSGASAPHAHFRGYMTPVLLDDTEIAWLEPETPEEREWLKGVPGDWTVWRMWSEAIRLGMVKGGFERGD